MNPEKNRGDVHKKVNNLSFAPLCLCRFDTKRGARACIRCEFGRPCYYLLRLWRNMKLFSCRLIYRSGLMLICRVCIATPYNSDLDHKSHNCAGGVDSPHKAHKSPRVEVPRMDRFLLTRHLSRQWFRVYPDIPPRKHFPIRIPALPQHSGALVAGPLRGGDPEQNSVEMPESTPAGMGRWMQ